MLWTLIALLSAALGAAGIALIARKLSGNRLPKWLIPASAGLGLLAYQIGYEYSWYDQQQLKFPAEAVVVAVEDAPQVWRPWTYIFPLTHAYTLLDMQSVAPVQMSEEAVVKLMLYRVENSFQDLITHQLYLLNCRQAQLLPLSEQGEPQLQKMRQLLPNDALILQACSVS